MKIALGMIIRNLDTDDILARFIENAEKHGHKLDCLIVAHTHDMNPEVAETLRRKLPLHSIDIKAPAYLAEQFRRLGMSDDAAHALLDCPIDPGRGMMPYGYKRTLVAAEAILRGMDVLFFVDYDVYPTVLKMTPGGPALEEADFFGAHLEHLNSGAQVTTGEYSGHNILPPASFDGMDDLLLGLQKEDMAEYWRSSLTHKGLTVQPFERESQPCTKVLGGNCAIKLSAFKYLPPFFSSWHAVGGETFLNRGEDTVLGLGIAKTGMVCIDIGLNPMHDTYKKYPIVPDIISSLADQGRFYYACTGWVGRNPLFNYVRGEDLKYARDYRRERLNRGLRALSRYTNNAKYINVLNNFDASWNSLPRYIEEYERSMESWSEFVDKVW